MLAFPSAADAVAASAAIQQALERRNRTATERVDLRVGIATGEVIAEDDDLHGLAANEAARICALAGPGEVLLSDLVRAMAGSRAPVELATRDRDAQGPSRRGHDLGGALGARGRGRGRQVPGAARPTGEGAVRRA